MLTASGLVSGTSLATSGTRLNSVSFAMLGNEIRLSRCLACSVTFENHTFLGSRFGGSSTCRFAPIPEPLVLLRVPIRRTSS